MTARFDCDLLVIGGGTAGIVGAKTAAGLGARCVLVERDRTGGDCLWTGCVPSKALLAAARTATNARGAARFGISTGPVSVDFTAVRAYVLAAIEQIAPADSPDALRAAGVEVLAGSARFVAPDRVSVNGQELRFRTALIATGSAPRLPSIHGLSTSLAVTSETVWDVEELPRRLLVIGGGSIGCELGQAFARLGSQVTVVEAAGRLLPAEDEVAAALVQRAMRSDGVEVRLGCSIAELKDGKARLEDRSVVPFDCVLVATGRTPRTADLDAAAARVALDDNGCVVVDGYLRTTNRLVWAAGDVTGPPLFTHVAGVHASAAATNAVLGLRRRAESVVPRVTFTDPEVASVGVSPDLPGVRVVAVEHSDVDRAVADGRTEGVSRLVLDGKGRVIGASIVGPRAGESIAEAALAIRGGLRARDLAGSMHAYPTYGDGVWNAAIADVRADLRRPVARLAIAALRWLRRRRVR
ncbi:MAG: dihydrolipoyl dehydrogenase family protein [Jatrophihabitans sp.]